MGRWWPHRRESATHRERGAGVCFVTATRVSTIENAEGKTMAQGGGGQGGGEPVPLGCPWEGELACLWQPQLGGVIPRPQSTQVQERQAVC